MSVRAYVSQLEQYVPPVDVSSSLWGVWVWVVVVVSQLWGVLGVGVEV